MGANIWEHLSEDAELEAAYLFSENTDQEQAEKLLIDELQTSTFIPPNPTKSRQKENLSAPLVPQSPQKKRFLSETNSYGANLLETFLSIKKNIDESSPQANEDISPSLASDLPEIEQFSLPKTNPPTIKTRRTKTVIYSVPSQKYLTKQTNKLVLSCLLVVLLSSSLSLCWQGLKQMFSLSSSEPLHPLSIPYVKDPQQCEAMGETWEQQECLSHDTEPMPIVPSDEANLDKQ